MAHKLLLRSALLAALLFAPCLAPAEDRYVPGTYATIQEAIEAASEGDRILIAPGTYVLNPDYNEWLLVDKSLTLMSESGLRDVTIIGSIDVTYLEGGGDRYFEMSGISLFGAVDVEMVTPNAWFYDCSFNPSPYWGGHGGVILQGRTHGVFESCEWDNVHGLYVQYGEVEVYSCAFKNRASIGLAYDYSDYSTVWDTRFTGGGGVFSDGAGCSVVSCEFQDRGGISGQFSVLELYYCTFFGGGIDANYGDVVECSFQGPGSTAIRGEVLLENSMVRGYDTGISLEGDLGCTLYNSLLSGNGTGIALTTYASAEIYNCTLSGNETGIRIAEEGGVFLRSSIVWGNGKDGMSPISSEVTALDSLVGNWDGSITTVGPQPILTVSPRFLRKPSHGRDGVFGTPDDDLGDLRLQSTSPCIDRGYGVVGGWDLSGRPRTNGPRVDIGAYEYWPLPLALGLITPDSCLRAKAQSVTIYGSSFQRGCTVRFGGAVLTPVFLSEASLRIALSSEDTSAAGVFEIRVVNPGGQVSDPLSFTVNNPRPGLEALDPPAVDHGSGDFMLRVMGPRIAPTATVYWNGTARQTIFVQETGETYAKIFAADVATPGKVAVTVANPGPGGGVSNIKTFMVR